MAIINTKKMKKIYFNDNLGLTQAVLEGRKTMTRRVFDKGWSDGYANFTMNLFEESVIAKYSRYKIGEVVAVAQSYKEAGFCGDELDRHKASLISRGRLDKSKGWANKMFVRADAMPHHIKITDINVERLQDISYDDCLREGITRCNLGKKFTCGDKHAYDTSRAAFAALIDKVSGKGTWNSNPWCFCYEFELID